MLVTWFPTFPAMKTTPESDPTVTIHTSRGSVIDILLSHKVGRFL